MNEVSDWPKISIVTPSYNQAPFLDGTIRSVINQGYPNLEYILMDGGSTDGSLDIIRKYEPWLAHWESHPDQGQSAAINKGWQRASGEILAWLNSDDLYLPGTLFRIANLWNKDNRAGFISGMTERIDHNGNPIGKLFGAELDIEKSLLTSINPVAQQSTFINRKALEEIGFLDESLHMSMDWDLWLRIGCKYPIRFIPEIWSQMRIWGETKTTKMFDKISTEHLKVIRKYHKNNKNYFSRENKRIAISATHCLAAQLYFSRNNMKNFRKEMFLSLLIYPRLRSGNANKLIGEAFPIIKCYNKLVSKLSHFLT